jgi:transcriptional regulator with XRE-family HTH domain
MRLSRSHTALPLPVQRALAKLGSDLSIARRRRRLPMELVAERALITRKTLGRVEKGDPAVSLGIYATVLFVLGLLERLPDLADPGQDAVGLSLEEENLPKRVRGRRS